MFYEYGPRATQTQYTTLLQLELHQRMCLIHPNTSPQEWQPNQNSKTNVEGLLTNLYHCIQTYTIRLCSMGHNFVMLDWIWTRIVSCSSTLHAAYICQVSFQSKKEWGCSLLNLSEYMQINQHNMANSPQQTEWLLYTLLQTLFSGVKSTTQGQPTYSIQTRCNAEIHCWVAIPIICVS